MWVRALFARYTQIVPKTVNSFANIWRTATQRRIERKGIITSGLHFFPRYFHENRQSLLSMLPKFITFNPSVDASKCW